MVQNTTAISSKHKEHHATGNGFESNPSNKHMHPLKHEDINAKMTPFPYVTNNCQKIKT